MAQKKCSPNEAKMFWKFVDYYQNQKEDVEFKISLFTQIYFHSHLFCYFRLICFPPTKELILTCILYVR